MRTFAFGLAFVGLSISAAAQEKFIGSNVDVRTVIAFKASETAVQKLLPEGWDVNAPAAGPSQGANLSLVLVDSVMAHDADGKSNAPFRGAVLVIPAKKRASEMSGPMVVGGLSSPNSAPGAYGVYLPAQAVIERTVRTSPDGKSRVEELWDFKADGGASIAVQVQYDRGPVTKSKVEPKVISGAKPEFFRIYRVEQGTDVARSTVSGVDRVSAISIRASGEKLASLLDGSERIISVISIPSYTRQLFLPSGS